MAMPRCWQNAVGVTALCLVRWMEREYHHIEASKPADSDTGSKAKEVMDEASLPVYTLAEVREPCGVSPFNWFLCLMSPASHATMVEMVINAGECCHDVGCAVARRMAQWCSRHQIALGGCQTEKCLSLLSTPHS